MLGNSFPVFGLVLNLVKTNGDTGTLN